MTFHTHSKTHAKRAFAALALLVTLALAIVFPTVRPVHAAGITVNTLGDSALGDPNCSLREAIINANNNAQTFTDCASGGGADTITFDPSIHNGTILLSSTLPDITDPAGLTIDATGAVITVSGNNSTRVMVVGAGAEVTLLGLTIADGFVDDDGAGLYIDGGTVTIENATVTGNEAANRNGGGGIYVDNGTLTINDSTISNNMAFTGGGVYAWNSTFIVDTSSFSSNVASSGGGIATNNGVDLTISDSVFSANEARTGLGGFTSGGGFGGAIQALSAFVDIVDTQFVSNIADGDGAGIRFGGALGTVTRSTFVGNSATGNSGISAGAGAGGGMVLFQSFISVADSTFASNTAVAGGAGIFVRGTEIQSSFLQLTGSTFDRNLSGFDGAAIRTFFGDMSVTNSTFSHNQNTGGNGGGAVLAFSDFTELTSNTFVGNISPFGIGGAFLTFNMSAPPVLTGNIFLDTTGTNCGGDAIIADSSNIADDDSCGAATQKTSAEINVGPLQDNGGPTHTHALLPGSHAIDFVSSASCLGDPVNGVDQRGEPRNVDIPGTGDDSGTSLCDAGAFEFQSAPTGTIHIVKDASPEDDTAFDFTGDLGDFTLMDPSDNMESFIDVPAGVYNVTELPTTGWTLQNITCDEDGTADSSDAGSTATITLEADETVTCTFSNAQDPATIIIEKRATPADDTGFHFSGDLGDFSLQDPSGNSITFNNLAPGSYDVTELPTAGWELTGLECDDNDSITSLPTATATIEASAGETVQCTFTNSEVVVTGVCPVEPAAGTVGYEWTGLLGRGMGGPTNRRMVAKIVVPNSDTVLDLYGQMAAKEVGAVDHAQFQYSDGTILVVQPATSTGVPGAVSWWGADLDESKLAGDAYVKGRWRLLKGSKSLKVPRAFVLYATFAANQQLANAWSTFDALGNYVSGGAAFNQSSINVLAIPETQDMTDVVVQVALTDINRDARSVDLTLSAGGVEQTLTLTGPVSKKMELLNLVQVILEDVPAGVDEVRISLQSELDTGDSAAVLGAAAHYRCATPTE